MCIRKKILEKVNNFINEQSLSVDYFSSVPPFFQEFFLTKGLDEQTVDVFVLALAEDINALKSFLGEELLSSQEFKEYLHNLNILYN